MTETEARACTEIELEMTPEMIAEMSNGLEPGESAFVQRNLSNLGAALTAKVMSKGFSDSPLVNVTRLSPNCSKPRNHAIDRLTPHHTAGVLSVESALEAIELFDRWKADAEYDADIRVGYNGKLYRCEQAHTSQEDWTPDATPALWTEVAPEGVIPVWRQPTGAQDAYNIGDKVHYPDADGDVWVSTIDANVYAPGVYGWEMVK